MPLFLYSGEAVAAVIVPEDHHFGELGLENFDRILLRSGDRDRIKLGLFDVDDDVGVLLWLNDEINPVHSLEFDRHAHLFDKM